MLYFSLPCPGSMASLHSMVCMFENVSMMLSKAMRSYGFQGYDVNCTIDLCNIERGHQSAEKANGCAHS